MISVITMPIRQTPIRTSTGGSNSRSRRVNRLPTATDRTPQDSSARLASSTTSQPGGWVAYPVLRPVDSVAPIIRTVQSGLTISAWEEPPNSTNVAKTKSTNVIAAVISVFLRILRSVTSSTSPSAPSPNSSSGRNVAFPPITAASRIVNSTHSPRPPLPRSRSTRSSVTAANSSAPKVWVGLTQMFSSSSDRSRKAPSFHWYGLNALTRNVIAAATAPTHHLPEIRCATCAIRSVNAATIGSTSSRNRIVCSSIPVTQLDAAMCACTNQWYCRGSPSTYGALGGRWFFASPA